MKKEAAEEEMNVFYSIRRDTGDEWNNANGTSSTTCKVYEGIKHVYNNYEAEYVWKGADDAYLNIRYFMDMIEKKPQRGNRGCTRYVPHPEIPKGRIWGGQLSRNFR
jgi:hypothetical protein